MASRIQYSNLIRVSGKDAKGRPIGFSVRQTHLDDHPYKARQAAYQEAEAYKQFGQQLKILSVEERKDRIEQESNNDGIFKMICNSVVFPEQYLD